MSDPPMMENYPVQTKCAVWLRVSSGGQNEASQEPDVDRWCEARDYQVVKTFRLHDISAYAGEQEQAQQEVIEAIGAGEFTVLVAWVGDRIERRGVEALLSFMRRVREAGGRVECSNDPLVNAVEHLGDLGPALAAWLAESESKRKSERIRISRDTSAREGSHTGRTNWGYESTGSKYARQRQPTAEAQIWVPRIYEAVLAGVSALDIAIELDDAGVKPMGIANADNPRGKGGRWHPRSIVALVHNPVYAGESATGLEVPPLVTWETWRAAQAALSARHKRGKASTADPKWLTGEAVACALCSGPMNKKGTPANPYLRCEQAARVDPTRKPCTSPANMVPWDLAVSMADRHISGLTEPVYELVTTAGNSGVREALFEEIERRARQAARLPFDQMMTVLRELEAERDSIPDEVGGRRETAPVLQPDGQPQTYGSLWTSLTTPERREFLTDEYWVSFANLDHHAAGRALERLGEPTLAEGSTGMWGQFATEPELLAGPISTADVPGIRRRGLAHVLEDHRHVQPDLAEVGEQPPALSGHVLHLEQAGASAAGVGDLDVWVGDPESLEPEHVRV